MPMLWIKHYAMKDLTIFLKSRKSCIVLGKGATVNLNGVFWISAVLRIISDQFAHHKNAHCHPGYSAESEKYALFCH